MATIYSSHKSLYRDFLSKTQEAHQIRRATTGEPTPLEYGRFGERAQAFVAAACQIICTVFCQLFHSENSVAATISNNNPIPKIFFGIGEVC